MSESESFNCNAVLIIFCNIHNLINASEKNKFSLIQAEHSNNFKKKQEIYQYMEP